MTPELMRALKPKITPQAAARMHGQYLTKISATNSTLGMLWWTEFWTVWAGVLFPGGAK